MVVGHELLPIVTSSVCVILAIEFHAVFSNDDIERGNVALVSSLKPKTVF